MIIPRSFIHEQKQHEANATHEYTSFFNPCAKTSTLHMIIPRSLIHEQKQACYS